jgi:hypothetical protein
MIYIFISVNMIKYRGDIGGVKVTKGMGLMRNIGMKTFGSDFIPLV